MTEPLEKYDMPPAYIYRLETSPRMISQFGLFTSYQVNVDANGNNIVGDAANESSITVDPTDHNRMAIGWRQFNSVQSNFRQGGWGYTTDGGTTWTFPGVLENNVFRSDPVMDSDETGNFFYLSLLETFCENMYGSTNGGQSWTGCNPTETQEEATSSGSPSIRPAARVTASNTRSGARLPLAPASGNSAVPPTAGSPGRLRLIFPTSLYGEHSTWIPMAIFLSAAKILEARFFAFARAMRRFGGHTNF